MTVIELKFLNEKLVNDILSDKFKAFIGPIEIMISKGKPNVLIFKDNAPHVTTMQSRNFIITRIFHELNTIPDLHNEMELILNNYELRDAGIKLNNEPIVEIVNISPNPYEIRTFVVFDFEVDSVKYRMPLIFNDELPVERNLVQSILSGIRSQLGSEPSFIINRTGYYKELDEEFQAVLKITDPSLCTLRVGEQLIKEININELTNLPEYEYLTYNELQLPIRKVKSSEFDFSVDPHIVLYKLVN